MQVSLETLRSAQGDAQLVVAFEKGHTDSKYESEPRIARLGFYFSNSHATFFKPRSARSMSCRMSFFACAAEKNAASICDGGR